MRWAGNTSSTSFGAPRGLRRWPDPSPTAHAPPCWPSCAGRRRAWPAARLAGRTIDDSAGAALALEAARMPDFAGATVAAHALSALAA
jgi:hypothetical protein